MAGSDKDAASARKRKALRENLARRKGQTRALKQGRDTGAPTDGPERMATRKRKLDGLLKPAADRDDGSSD